jgi:outer membrane usher protein
MARPSSLSADIRFGVALLLVLGQTAAPAQDLPNLSAAAASAALQPALFDVTVNGQAAEEPVEFLRDIEGRLYIKAEMLRAWRIRLPAFGAMQYDGETYYPATALPALRLAVAEHNQSIAIDADASAFEMQNAALDDPELMAMTQPSSGAYLDYDLFVEHVREQTSGAGAFEGGLFTRLGAATTSLIASAGDGGARLTRLETTWTIDRPSDMTSIRIGDSISAVGPGGVPVRFAGVQYARNFAVRPGYLTMPLPVASGSAAVPSVVDVYVNNMLQAQQQVSPGPFELSNVPVPSGGGRVQLVVRDLLGREIVSEQSYYASSQLLRAGLHDFSYEAGFLRQAFGRESNQYGSFFVSTAHRYGFSDRLTGEAIVQASESRQMAGAALTALVLDLAQVGGAMSVSRSERGTGFRAAASFERRASAFSFGLSGEYASSAYAVIGIDDRPPRHSVQAFADMPVAHGSVGLNFLHRSPRGAPDETIAGVFGSYPLAANVGLQLYARHSVVGQPETGFGGHISVALGGRRSASASFDRSHARNAGYVSYQEDPPAGPGGGFHAIARLGQGSGAEATYVHNFQIASVTAQASLARGDVGVRLSAAGALGWMGGRGFASRTLGESFATVRLAGFPGVHVYADDRAVGKTDRDGFIVIPGLRPFERNMIRIEQADLPLDTTLVSEEVAVRPFAHAGTSVRFDMRRERGVLMRVRLPDGGDLPAGALVRIEGSAQSFVAVSGGEVYVPDISGSVALSATWAGQSCRFAVTVPETDDPQPRIDGLVCARSDDYAAR